MAIFLMIRRRHQLATKTGKRENFDKVYHVRREAELRPATKAGKRETINKMTSIKGKVYHVRQGVELRPATKAGKREIFNVGPWTFMTIMWMGIVRWLQP